MFFFPSRLHTHGSFCSFGFISISEARFYIPCWPQTHGSLLSQSFKSESHVSHRAWAHSRVLDKLSSLRLEFPSLVHAAQVWTVMAHLLFSFKCQFLPDLFLSTPIPELSLLGTKAAQQLLGSLPDPCWCVALRGSSYGVCDFLPQLYSLWNLDRCWFNWIIVVESREQPSPPSLFLQSDL